MVLDPYNDSDPAYRDTPLESPTDIPTVYNRPRTRFQQPGSNRGGPGGFGNNQRPPFQYPARGALRYDPQHGLQPQGYMNNNNPYQQGGEQKQQLMRPFIPPEEFLDQHLDVFQAISYELPDGCLQIKYGEPEQVDLDIFCAKGIVDNLLDSKAKLRSIPPEMFSRARQRCNPYELVGSSIFINRASVKLASIDSQLALTATKDDPTGGQGQEDDVKTFRFADLCSGPGGFSEYLLWRKHTWGERARGWAITLRGGDLDFHLERFHKDTVVQETLKIFYGEDGTGNLLKQENIDSFTDAVERDTKGLGVGLVSADGGVSVDGDEAVQETLLQRLILCQILTMFKILQKGGDFVVKVFDIFTPVTAGLIWILSRNFQKICVVKPLTSRPMNSERYVVCRHLLNRKPAHVIEHLTEVNSIYQKIQDESTGLLPSSLSEGTKKNDVNHLMDFDVLKKDEHFMEYIKRNNMKTAVRQIEALDVFLKYVNEGLRPAFDQEAIKRLCLQEWRIPPRPQPQHPHQQQQQPQQQQQHHHHQSQQYRPHQSHQQQHHPYHGHQQQQQHAYPNHPGSGQRNHHQQNPRPHGYAPRQHPYANSEGRPPRQQHQGGLGGARPPNANRGQSGGGGILDSILNNMQPPPDGDPCEKLKRKIKTITEIAGDNYDQFTDNVAKQEEEKKQQQEDGLSTKGETTQDQESKPAGGKDTEPSTSAASASTSATVTVTSTNAAAGATPRITTPQGIYDKLWRAQNEIGLALDALNIIISSYQTNSGTTNGIGGVGGGVTAMPNTPALPPGSLKCEYVPKPIPTSSALISNEKMALGGKKHQLRNASDILMQGAHKLEKVMSDESQFWEGALRLHKNNWCIVASKPGHHGNRLASGSQLFVQYGFQDVGSMHGNRSYAELIRNPTTSDSEKGKEKSMKLNIPNKTGKVIVMSLVQQGAPHTLDKDKAKGILKLKHMCFLNSRSKDEQVKETQYTTYTTLGGSRYAFRCVSIVDNEIFLPINDDLELKIAYRAPNAEERTKPSLSDSQQLSQSPNEYPGIYDSENAELSKSLVGTSEILRCAMQLMQHRRYRQNIRERIDSFFKSSRPGGGRTAGSFGQIQQVIQQRPMAVLNMALQALQYYSFSRRIREVIGKVTRKWEPLSIHSIDIKAPPPSRGSPSERNAAATATAGAPLSSYRSTPSYGMGSAVSIHLGTESPPIRFVMRSHPAPCVVLQLSDRPSSPIMHVAEFERALEQELTARAIERICEVVNSIQVWCTSLPAMQSPKFVIDIDRRCVGMFQIPHKNGITSSKTALVILELDATSDQAISITLVCKYEGNTKTRRIYLEDMQFQEHPSSDNSDRTVHPHDNSANSIIGSEQPWGRAMTGFKGWIKHSIISELEL
ncbi:FtsJ methyltransferase domain-containing protein 2 [Entomortierella beljakovae]|nr:FtsJ methyltransferase domain-containing protein 2 [Entomortierella beljakovae]